VRVCVCLYVRRADISCKKKTAGVIEMPFYHAGSGGL